MQMSVGPLMKLIELGRELRRSREGRRAKLPLQYLGL